MKNVELIDAKVVDKGEYFTFEIPNGYNLGRNKTIKNGKVVRIDVKLHTHYKEKSSRPQVVLKVTEYSR